MTPQLTLIFLLLQVLQPVFVLRRILSDRLLAREAVVSRFGVVLCIIDGGAIAESNQAGHSPDQCRAAEGRTDPILHASDTFRFNSKLATGMEFA